MKIVPKMSFKKVYICMNLKSGEGEKKDSVTTSKVDISEFYFLAMLRSITTEFFSEI